MGLSRDVNVRICPDAFFSLEVYLFLSVHSWPVRAFEETHDTLILWPSAPPSNSYLPALFVDWSCERCRDTIWLDSDPFKQRRKSEAEAGENSLCGLGFKAHGRPNSIMWGDCPCTSLRKIISHPIAFVFCVVLKSFEKCSQWSFF